MKGINHVQLSGTVSDFIFDKTGQGMACCSFKLSMTGRGGIEVSVRCNAYGPYFVNMCGDFLDGDYVVLSGELMRRSMNLMEVRIGELIYLDVNGDISDKVVNDKDVYDRR